MGGMPKRPRDPSQLAKQVFDIAIGEAEDTVSASKRNPPKQQVGGLKGGVANYFGEIYGKIYALFKESRQPKIQIREHTFGWLVDCFFTDDMYHAVVDLLNDKEAIIFVEGHVEEDLLTGAIVSVQATDFKPAPQFSLEKFNAPGLWEGEQAPSEDVVERFRIRE